MRTENRITEEGPVKVTIKDLQATIELKNNGMELEVRDPQGNHRGDLVITKTQLVWCKGKTNRANGVAVTWNDFIDWMESD
jgi:hypothetical protein